ncbi:MAG: hypothetical protein ACRD1V_11665 [Vicinamibacterales bacterium]
MIGDWRIGDLCRLSEWGLPAIANESALGNESPITNPSIANRQSPIRRSALGTRQSAIRSVGPRRRPFVTFLPPAGDPSRMLRFMETRTRSVTEKPSGDTDPADTKTRQFFWGLSSGIIILGVAGAFWLMLAAVAVSAVWAPQDLALFHGSVNTRVLALWGTSLVLPTLVIVFGGLHVRRKAAGFTRYDLRRPELIGGARAIQRQSQWIALAQLVGCVLAAWLGVWFHREDLIWPGTGLVVSLHFAPLGFMFRMRPYLVLAAVGTMVAIVSLVLPTSILTPQTRFELIGVGMGGPVWIIAGYVILRADRLATRWASHDARSTAV